MRPNELALHNLEYGGKPVRVEVVNDELWFCLADVGRVLEMKNPRDFVKSDWCDQDGVDSFYIMDDLNRNQETTFISEPNLYALVMRSTKPEAKAFSRWVTHEVLPSIRKSGNYSITAGAGQAVDPFLTLLDGVKSLYIQQKEMNDRLTLVETRIEESSSRLLALPEGGEVRELTTREMCRMAVDDLAKITGVGHQELWNRVYREFDYVHGCKITTLSKNRNISKIEYVEKFMGIEKLYSIIKKMIDRAA